MNNTGGSGMKLYDFFVFSLNLFCSIFLFYSDFGNHASLKQGKKIVNVA